MTGKEIHNEKLLLDKLSTGDEAAFHILYRHYYLQLKPVVRSYIRSDSEAEEILQEAFMKLWLNRDKLHGIKNFRAWLYRIASREYLMYLRKKLSYQRKLSVLASRPEWTGTDSSFEHTSLEEIRKLISEAVSTLPPQRRLIFELSRNQGLKVEEIAAQLSITSRTVKNVLSTSLRYIREHLTAAGHGPFLVLQIVLLLK